MYTAHYTRLMGMLTPFAIMNGRTSPRPRSKYLTIFHDRARHPGRTQTTDLPFPWNANPTPNSLEISRIVNYSKYYPYLNNCHSVGS